MEAVIVEWANCHSLYVEFMGFQLSYLTLFQSKLDWNGFCSYVLQFEEEFFCLLRVRKFDLGK